MKTRKPKKGGKKVAPSFGFVTLDIHGLHVEEEMGARNTFDLWMSLKSTEPSLDEKKKQVPAGEASKASK